MAKREVLSWNPTDIVEVTNTSGENIVLELKSGLLRLDSGRSVRLTASALEQPDIKALLHTGKISVQENPKK